MKVIKYVSLKKKVLKKFLKDKGYIPIKLEKTKSQHLVSSLEVNNVLGVFLIDTGASNSCISEEKKSFFSIISVSDDLELMGAGPEKLKAKPSKKSSIHYKGVFLLKLKFFLLNLTPINASLTQHESQEIDGIIGADFLKKTKAIIDYKNKWLFLKL